MSDKPIAYLVTDGWTDIYGVFLSRAAAQAWIERQHRLGYPWWDGLQIDEWPLDEGEDLRPL